MMPNALPKRPDTNDRNKDLRSLHSSSSLPEDLYILGPPLRLPIGRNVVLPTSDEGVLFRVFDAYTL